MNRKKKEELNDMIESIPSNTNNIQMETMIGTTEEIENDGYIHVKPNGKIMYIIYCNYNDTEIEKIHHSIYNFIKEK